jgi:hypothetical protein
VVLDQDFQRSKHDRQRRSLALGLMGQSTLKLLRSERTCQIRRKTRDVWSVAIDTSYGFVVHPYRTTIKASPRLGAKPVSGTARSKSVRHAAASIARSIARGQTISVVGRARDEASDPLEAGWAERGAKAALGRWSS